jgi:hypothetical protein
MRRLLLALWLALVPMSGNAACRLALALALDVSGSVNADEYRLQMSGLAAALGDPDVEAALFAIPDAPVTLAVFEWSSSRYQQMIQDWIVIEDRAVLESVRARIAGWERRKAPEATGLGAAMEYGKVLLDRAPVCWTRTLDVSGDGKNNDWPDPQMSRDTGMLAGIRINGLVVAGEATDSGGLPSALDAEELSAYFHARVIQGPDAFVEVALGFENYAEAMQRKLLRELKAEPVASHPDWPTSEVVASGPRRENDGQ